MWWVPVWKLLFHLLHNVKKHSQFLYLLIFCFADEVCGIHIEQQHHRWPLSGVCQPEGLVTSGFYSELAQLTHRFSHVCCLPSCGRGLQVHLGKKDQKPPLVVIYLNLMLKCQIKTKFFTLSEWKAIGPWQIKILPLRPCHMNRRYFKRVYVNWIASWRL